MIKNNKVLPRAIFLLGVLLFSSCKSESSNSWQGTHYPNGCLTCDKDYKYSPTFKTFLECKSWAQEMIVNSEDKSSCGKNCKFNAKDGMSKCDEVVRSWYIPLIDNVTMSKFKE